MGLLITLIAFVTVLDRKIRRNDILSSTRADIFGEHPADCPSAVFDRVREGRLSLRLHIALKSL